MGFATRRSARSARLVTLAQGCLRNRRASYFPGTKAVERGHEDWLEVAGIALDRGDGDNHVEDLLEGEIVTDLLGALCGGEERSAGGEHSGTVVVE